VSEQALDPVNWDLARRVAKRVGGTEPLADSYLYGSLQGDFEELTSIAEQKVSEATGLAPLTGPARARVTDRAGWVDANVASFRRLVSPITSKIAERVTPPLASVSRNMAGAQVGAILGWMSTRVLGQYDILMVEDDRPEDQDIVYYVGPNVLALEKRYGFPPRQFRLWLALHEVTHRAQFTGIPWMRDYFASLVDQALAAVDPDPRKLLEGLRRALAEVRSGHNPLGDGGLLSILAGDEQVAVLWKVQALMSLLEGHGDVTMDRAAVADVPEAARFARVLRQRRQQASPVAKVLQQLTGIDAKLRQYEQGERFIEAVERVGGPQALAPAWRDAQMLPTLEEIRDPDSWLARVAHGAAAAG
jgi:coenzyme F420 biosynthesis associated uncharacterized protein